MSWVFRPPYSRRQVRPLAPTVTPAGTGDFAITGSGGTVAMSGTTNVAGSLGITGGTGTVSMRQSSGPLLDVSANGRYLIDTNNGSAPFLIWGVANWLIHLEISPTSGSSFPNSAGSTLAAGQDAWFTAMAAKGVNAVVIQLLSKYQSTAPNDSAGNSPFTGAMFTTPRDAYFDAVKDLIAKAATYGFVVGIAPVWAGYDSSQGFYTDVESASNADMQSYGAYVAGKYGGYDNIFWIMGGDRPSPSATLDTRYENLLTGIVGVDNRHILTTHWNFASGDSPFITGTDVTSCYNWAGGTVYQQVETEYAEADAPVMMLEALYEENTGFGFTRPIGRFQTISSLLSGSLAGIWWGHEGTWHAGGGNPGSQPNLPSQSAGIAYDLNSVGINDYAAIRRIIGDRAYHALVPDTTSTLVTSGRGSAGTGYVTAAFNTTLAIIYPTTTGDFAVDLSEFARPVRGIWYDPTNGASVQAGYFTNSGSQTFNTTTPGTNAVGDTDWILVLETGAPPAPVHRAQRNVLLRM